MRVGVVFPQIEIGADPIAVRDYVQTAEDLGYSHLIAYDHVLGADTRYHQGWTGGYTLKDMFHEPFVTFGYMGRLHQDPGTGHCDSHPGAAADRSGCQASGRGGCAQWRPAAVGSRHWLEPRGIRSSGPELPQPGAAQ
jgi:hypothetical protein